MKAVRIGGAIAAGLAAALVLGAAARPRALAEASPGLWELSGIPDRPARARRCIADTMVLARIEHEGRACTQVVITDAPTKTVIHYTCTVGGFGQTELTALTPRSLRIQTQGISGNAPFNYTFQARRVGAC